LKLEIFYSLREAQAIIGASRDPYNWVRPHSSLGDRPPAPVSPEALAHPLPTLTFMQ
ncbi:MAG: transposase, partial [Nitrospiraceae bacterium]|nr:transposase [Nitrospiraceae bacterium]